MMDIAAKWSYQVTPTGPTLCRVESNIAALTDVRLHLFGGRIEQPILIDLRLSEAFAAYANGDRLYDISRSRFDLAPCIESDRGPTCLAAPKELASNLLCEVHDDQIRFRRGEETARGRTIRVWSTLTADTYRYLIEYALREDGSISCRLGLTGHNAFPLQPDGGDAHLHVGCWRIEFDLGAPARLMIQVLELGEDGSPHATVFNNGCEGGIRWRPERFTRVRILNSAADSALVGYDLVPQRAGPARTFGASEEFLNNDFWVTRANTANSDGNNREFRYSNLPYFVSRAEPLAGHPVVLWHQSGFAHIPRGEDFGRVGFNNEEGVALTMWTGFTLHPIWGETSLMGGRRVAV